MGEEVPASVFTREDRQRYREKVHRCLDVLARMLAEIRFDFDDPLTGMEIELNLVDERRRPGDAQHRGAGRSSTTRRSRPSSAGSTWRSTCRRGSLAGDAMVDARGRRAGPAQRRAGEGRATPAPAW